MKKIIHNAIMRHGKFFTSKIGSTIVRTIFILSTVQLMFVSLLMGNVIATFEGAVVLALFIFLILKDRLVDDYVKLTDDFAKGNKEMLEMLRKYDKVLKKCEKRSAARLGSIHNLEKKLLEYQENGKQTTKKKKAI